MKNLARLIAVVVLLASSTVFAANLDGTYTFSSRVKEGKPDMVGWNGTMTIAKDTMARTYTAPAPAKETKFYEGTMKQEGDLYSVKFTKAYKPEYVGQEHKNKITLSGNTLTLGKFLNLHG